MKKQTKYLILLLILTQGLAIYGCYYLFGDTPTDCPPETEEKAFFYRGPEAMAVLNNEEINAPSPKEWGMYDYRKEEFLYKEGEIPDDYSVKLTKLESLNYNLNVYIAKNQDTINLDLDLKLVDCTKKVVDYIYNFKVSNHPWVKVVYIELEIEDGECTLKSVEIREHPLRYFSMGKSCYFILKYWLD